MNLNYLKSRGYQNFYLLLIYDNNDNLRLQFINSSHKDIKQIFLAEKREHTSLGGVAGKITSGSWRLVCYLPPRSESFIIRIQVKAGSNSKVISTDYPRLTAETWATPLDQKNDDTKPLLNDYCWNRALPTERDWYDGDLHCHSLLSDGRMKPEELHQEAARQNLDFYFITEHNLLPTGWPQSEAPPLSIPGMEVTTSRGHFNLLGVDRLYYTADYIKLLQGFKASESFSLSAKIMTQIMERAKNNGAQVIICHPFLSDWAWDYDEITFEQLTGLEVLLDPRLPGSKESSVKAIKLLDYLWQNKIFLWGFGGSDIHMKPGESYAPDVLPSKIGQPRNIIKAPELSPSEVIKSLAKGKLLVATGLDLTWKGQGVNTAIYPGDNITSICLEGNKIKITLEVNLSSEYKKARLLWLEDGIPRQEKKIVNRGQLIVEIAWSGRQYRWGRMEVRAADNRLLAFSNPLYCLPPGQGNSAKSAELTWGEAVKKLSP